MFSLFFSRRLVAPLQQITKAAKDFAEGRRHVDLPEGLKDEVGILSEAFNRMITEVGSHNEELRLSEEKQRFVLNTATEAIITTDEKGVINQFNSAAIEIFGFSS